MTEDLQKVLDTAECLYDRHAVQQAIQKLADQIRQDLAGKNPLVLCIMTGGLIPAGLLLPELDFILELDYIHATRYQGETRGGELNWKVEPSYSLKDRHVLIIDDILDEGLTLKAIVAYCLQQGASSVRSAVLSIKHHGREHAIQADYVGLDLPDRYVFGCGMDYKGYFRNLPGIYAVGDIEYE